MISLFFFLLSSLGCVIAANLIKSDKKIIDIVHHNLPYVHLPYVSDALVLTQTVGCATVLDHEALSEFFLIMGIAQLCRILTMTSTVLPPLKNYHDKYRMGGINGTGTEYIFSGHACYACLSAIYLYTYKIVPLHSLIVYNLISQMMIVLSRNHYSVDVVLAWIIVPLIYGNVIMCKQLEYCTENIVNIL
jgi:hypothetical protein